MTLLPLIVSLGTQVWLARELGRVGLGEYHATALFVIVLTTVVLLGFPAVSAQRIAGVDEHRPQSHHAVAGTALTLAFGFSGVVSLLAILFAAPFGRLFGIGTEPVMWNLGLAAFGASMNSFTVHALIASLDLRAATAAVVSQPLGVGLAIALRPIGVELAGSDLAAVGFATSGIVGSLLLIRRGVRPVLVRSEAAYMLRRSGPAMRLTYPALITGWIDRALVGMLLGPAALGAFVAASALVEALQRAARAGGSVAVSAYARLTGDPVGLERVLDSHIRLAAGVFIVAGAVFISAGAGVLSLIFGPTFAIATTTLRLLSIAALPLTLTVTLASHSIGTDMRSSARLLALLGITHVLLTGVLTMTFHIAGTALANVVIWSVGAVLYLRQAFRWGAPVQIRTFLHIAGVAAPVFSVSWIIGLQGLPWMGAGSIACSVALIPVLTILIREPEWRLLRRIAGRARPDGAT